MRHSSVKRAPSRIYSGRLALAAILSSVLWVVALSPLAGQAQPANLMAYQLLQL